MIAFAAEEKRALAIQLIASGKWNAEHWASLSAIVQNSSIGLLPDGRLVMRPRPAPERKEQLTIHEAADMAGVHPATIRRWLRLGYLPATHGADDAPIISRAALQCFLDTRAKQ